MNDLIFDLTSFAPFVQFVSGIYLVFLYDQIFKNNPLSTQIESISCLFQNLVNENQGCLSQEDLDHVQEFKENRENRWANQFHSLKKISFVSFLFSMSLLFYIGLEKWMLTNCWEQSLIVPSIVILLYNAFIFFIPFAKNIVATCRFSGIMFILLVVYVIFFCLLSDCLSWFDAWGVSMVYVLTLFSMSFGMLLYGGNLIYKCAKFLYIRHQLKKIPKKMNLYLCVKMGIRGIDDLSKKEKYFLLKKSFETNRPITDMIDDLIRDEFQKFYKKILKK